MAWKTCPACKGSGKSSRYGAGCLGCGGSGQIEQPDPKPKPKPGKKK
jgi:DnaJ-class molecular chaperone